MSHRYAPLPNPRSDTQTQRDQEEEMAAAFDYSEDEDDEQNTSETRPLNSHSYSNNPRDATIPISSPEPTTPSISHVPGTYDFENVDYDRPPPGSPPGPSTRALPNDHGNTNGLVPSFESVQLPRHNWFQKAAGVVLPSRVAAGFGLGLQRPSGPVGSGTINDGVFANVTAKPSAPVRIQDGDSSYVVPEMSGGEAPPSYATAQADAVPPYWETTIHAPFSPDSAGEMIIDALATGSVFSFLWNMLVSVSFQFVGFLLTYLLHTTHAARLGSRAGLGITLIQYGFALRGNIDAANGEGGDAWDNWRDPARPTFGSGSDSNGWFGEHGMANNGSSAFPTGSMPDDQASSMVANATAEWLSFFLMTVGWFILLTSLLGFWRVKRWERGILASQRESNVAVTSSQPPNLAVVSRIEQVFGLRGGSRGDLFRQGFGFGPRHDQEDEEITRAVIRAEEGEVPEQPPPADSVSLLANSDDATAAALRAMILERRLQAELRNSGLM